MRMHADEVEIDAELVTRLIADQCPELSDLPIRAAPSTGTVNAIYRLGDELYARLPRVPAWAADLEREWRWLPTLAPHVSLQVPVPVVRGRPTDIYPLPWAVYRWIEGEPYAHDRVADEPAAAHDLARFVLQLRAIPIPRGAPRTGRRPLAQLADGTRADIEAAGSVIDSAAAGAAWERALDAPAWDGSPVWIHTDLLSPNVLARGGRICAVLDFGSVGVGDPAADVIAAWSIFGAAGRAAYRTALDVDDDTWNRARGYALHQAAAIIPYYRETNPGFVTLAQRTVEQVLADS